MAPVAENDQQAPTQIHYIINKGVTELVSMTMSNKNVENDKASKFKNLNCNNSIDKLLPSVLLIVKKLQLT